MFSGARSFNQPLNNWDVSNVRDMREMFKGAISFNQSLNKWNVSKAVNMGATPGPVGWHDHIVDAQGFPHPQALRCHAQEHQNLKEFARKGRVRFPAG